MARGPKPKDYSAVQVQVPAPHPRGAAAAQRGPFITPLYETRNKVITAFPLFDFATSLC